ncbi:glycoside hydrolase family 43 protein [Hyaloscypha bicolor E]|uniref:Glycoside hydrolase family 43 protein n=1 Tax=Hyaloscypha bicolor E TaxID=1095630 RepID=A0A2J6TPD8_9HELO|nr:glycoside hydrolase family 43 protein [Hyaloscypha bicolor E]PMD64880.1 glycoside hydrolase family 43 protein [Hyaloscypha bicolor E]
MRTLLLSNKRSSQHCVGAATMDTVPGPYTAAATPLACPLSAGGTFNASGFTNADGTY